MDVAGTRRGDYFDEFGVLVDQKSAEREPYEPEPRLVREYVYPDDRHDPRSSSSSRSSGSRPRRVNWFDRPANDRREKATPVPQPAEVNQKLRAVIHETGTATIDDFQALDKQITWLGKSPLHNDNLGYSSDAYTRYSKILGGVACVAARYLIGESMDHVSAGILAATIGTAVASAKPRSLTLGLLGACTSYLTSGFIATPAKTVLGVIAGSAGIAVINKCDKWIGSGTQKANKLLTGATSVAMSVAAASLYDQLLDQFPKVRVFPETDLCGMTDISGTDCVSRVICDPKGLCSLEFPMTQHPMIQGLGWGLAVASGLALGYQLGNRLDKRVNDPMQEYPALLEDSGRGHQAYKYHAFANTVFKNAAAQAQKVQARVDRRPDQLRDAVDDLERALATHPKWIPIPGGSTLLEFNSYRNQMVEKINEHLDLVRDPGKRDINDYSYQCKCLQALKDATNLLYTVKGFSGWDGAATQGDKDLFDLRLNRTLKLLNDDYIAQIDAVQVSQLLIESETDIRFLKKAQQLAEIPGTNKSAPKRPDHGHYIPLHLKMAKAAMLRHRNGLDLNLLLTIAKGDPGQKDIIKDELKHLNQAWESSNKAIQGSLSLLADKQKFFADSAKAQRDFYKSVLANIPEALGDAKKTLLGLPEVVGSKKLLREGLNRLKITDSLKDVDQARTTMLEVIDQIRSENDHLLQDTKSTLERLETELSSYESLAGVKLTAADQAAKAARGAIEKKFGKKFSSPQIENAKHLGTFDARASALESVSSVIGQAIALNELLNGNDGDLLAVMEKHSEAFVKIGRELNTLNSHELLPGDVAALLLNLVPMLRDAFIMRGTAQEYTGIIRAIGFEAQMDDEKEIQKSLEGLNCHKKTAEDCYLMAYESYAFAEKMSKLQLDHIKDGAKAYLDSLIKQRLKAINEANNNRSLCGWRSEAPDPVEKLSDAEILRLKDDATYKNLLKPAHHKTLEEGQKMGDQGMKRAYKGIERNINIAERGYKFLVKYGKAEDPALHAALGNLIFTGRTYDDPVERYTQATSHFKETVRRCVTHDPKQTKLPAPSDMDVMGYDVMQMRSMYMLKAAEHTTKMLNLMHKVDLEADPKATATRYQSALEHCKEAIVAEKRAMYARLSVVYGPDTVSKWEKANDPRMKSLKVAELEATKVYKNNLQWLHTKAAEISLVLRMDDKEAITNVHMHNKAAWEAKKKLLRKHDYVKLEEMIQRKAKEAAAPALAKAEVSKAEAVRLATERFRAKLAGDTAGVVSAEESGLL